MTDMDAEERPDIPAPLNPERRQESPSPSAAGGGKQ